MFSWFSFLTYAIVTAITPGPNNILSMSNGSRKGFRGGPALQFRHPGRVYHGNAGLYGLLQPPFHLDSQA